MFFLEQFSMINWNRLSLWALSAGGSDHRDRLDYYRVPVEYQDEKPVTLELWLHDEQENEFSYEFTARIDRSLKRKHERRQHDRRLPARLVNMQTSLYATDKNETSLQHDKPAD